MCTQRPSILVRSNRNGRPYLLDCAEQCVYLYRIASYKNSDCEWKFASIRLPHSILSNYDKSYVEYPLFFIAFCTLSNALLLYEVKSFQFGKRPTTTLVLPCRVKNTNKRFVMSRSPMHFWPNGEFCAHSWKRMNTVPSLFSNKIPVLLAVFILYCFTFSSLCCKS